MQPKNIVFLVSGGGGNLRFIEKATQKGWLANTRIAAVIADRKCPALDFARSLEIEAKVSDFSSQSQAGLAAELEKWSPSAVITNVHKILTDEIVNRFRNRLINLHYSLLPAFQGTIGVRPVQQALAYGAKFVGVTAHHVDEGVDTGRPIAQAVIPIKSDDTEHELMDIIFRCGCLSLLAALNDLLHANSSEQVCKAFAVKGRDVLINPTLDVPDELLSESFWNELRTQQSADPD